jgi:L-fucose isomerase-like protein
MTRELNRRHFLGTSAAGATFLHTIFSSTQTGHASSTPLAPGKTKTRVGKVYLGHPTPGWPSHQVDLAADVKAYEEQFEKLMPELQDIEFVDGQLVSSMEQCTEAIAKFDGKVDGILAIHLSLGTGGYIAELLKLNVPVMLFTLPYAGHEWHTIAPLQKQGAMIEVLPSSDYRDLLTAIRPFRAIHRLNEAKLLCISRAEVSPDYAQAIKDKFGTEIKQISLDRLTELYHSADQNEVDYDARQWISNARKIVEPTREEIYNSSRMYVAMKNLLAEEQADTVTIDCLGMGLMQRGMAYPCLGFARLDDQGLGGVCEADLKSSMTHLIFMFLTGKPGFVTDPVFDLANSTLIHAHCVSPLKMDGPQGESCAYDIRSHLEDNQGVSLRVIMRTGQKVSMARLIGAENLLFSTAEIVDTPDVNRGCRTKITTKVKNPQRLLENWSCGLHRVVFYGDHTTDIRRFCRFRNLRLIMEEEEIVHDIPGLEWETYVHA